MKKILILFYSLFILFLLTSCDIFDLFRNHYTCDIYKDAIYLIDTDGNNLTKVVDLGHTESTCEEDTIDLLPGASIQFSADGNKLIYCKYIRESHINSLYFINLDGSDNTLLTEDLNVKVDGGQPSISRIESKIVFPTDIEYWEKKHEEYSDIFIVNFDATGLIHLTNTYGIDEMYPCFSPNGYEIIYSTSDYLFTTTNYSINRLNINCGTLYTLATNNEYAYTHLAVSPDGTKIYFSAYIDHSRPFFVINSDGTNQTQLYDNIDLRDFLSFSSDGSKIVYNDYYYLYIMNTDGSGITQIETSLYHPQFPTTSHDGTKILYSGSSIIDSIYIIDTNGANETMIHEGFGPAFSPNNNKIAFSGYYFYETYDYWE